jgi:hypothetical protein
MHQINNPIWMDRLYHTNACKSIRLASNNKLKLASLYTYIYNVRLLRGLGISPDWSAYNYILIYISRSEEWKPEQQQVPAMAMHAYGAPAYEYSSAS